MPLFAQTNSDPCAIENLPAGVQRLLKSKFPDLRPKKFSDLGEDDQKLWSTSNPRSCPGIVVGNFQAHNQYAYAILLVPKSGTEDQYHIVVFAPSQGSAAYQISVLDKGRSTHDSGLVISKVPPGKQIGLDESVRLKLDGINVEWLEKASVLYYFSNARYQHLQTSD